MVGLYRSRLTGNFDGITARFISSLKGDERIFEEDIDGTEAHDIMLCEQGIISRNDLSKILSALEKLRSEMRGKKIEFTSDVEDIHEFIESFVIREVGIEAGGKLHTGRSRNDQVAVDIRMHLRSELINVLELILNLIAVLLKRAENHINTYMPLYTHTQQAQLGVFSHYLLAYTDALFRNFQRILNCYERVNISPLGAGPIGGSSLNLDRRRTASLLGFDDIVENSIDAVSSRDFALEAASTLSILMSTLSRMAEDFILWSSTEFGYLDIAEEYSSVSSVMPHKKNPCTLELIRGKTGKVYGALTNLFITVKGLPTGYNRDLQETKSPLWNSIDTVKQSLQISTGVVSTVKVNKSRMRKVVLESYAFAMDLAERLVETTSLPFRESHKLVGNLIKEMVTSGIKPVNLKPKMLEVLADKLLGVGIPITDDMITSVLDMESCLSRRKTLGSPEPREVNRMIKARRRQMNDYGKQLKKRIRRLQKSKRDLIENVEKHLNN